MNKWKVTFRINSYMHFDEKVTIRNVEFFRKSKNNFAVIYIENLEDENEAKNIAIKKLESVINSIRFILDQNIDYQLKSIIQLKNDGSKNQGLNLLPSKITVVKGFPKSKVDNIEQLSNITDSANKKKKVAFKYYLRGLSIDGWNNEVFLNYYKAIELISAPYFKEGEREKEKENRQKREKLINELKYHLNNDNSDEYDEIIKKIYKLGFVASERKIKLAIKNLNLSIKDYNIKNIVKIRNEIASHASSKSYIKTKDVEECQQLSKNLILSYFTS